MFGRAPSGGNLEANNAPISKRIGKEEVLPLHRGRGAPPGAPTGGIWLTVKYWGLKSWALQVAIVLLQIGLTVFLVTLDMAPLAAIVNGAFLFVYVMGACGAVCDARLDKRTVYSVARGSHGDIAGGGGSVSNENYDEHGNLVMPDCCNNMNPQHRWGAG